MKVRLDCLIAHGVTIVFACWQPCSAIAQAGSGGSTAIEITSPAPPPEWALWQRQLLDQLWPSALEFVRHYTRPDGTLIWRDQWPGMDGSDDGYESFYNFPLYYALGGPPETLALARKLWDAVTRQFTRYGQVHREFDSYYDWMHHGESYVNFYFFGLADPSSRALIGRARRFAGFYMNEDPAAPNYDPLLKLIRSPINGSRGPQFVNSADDWVTHREVLAFYPLPYSDIPNVTASGAWTNDTLFPFILQTMNQRMMRGDVPLNLTATSLMLNAGMLTGEAKYQRWIEDYVSAWMSRMQTNGGILPDNVGLSGKIGENMDGKWWGGYYGWRWPHGFFNLFESAFIGAANACLASGDLRYLDLPRAVLRLAESQGRTENGRFVAPHRHDERGWHDYRPINPSYPIHLWFLSRSGEDYDRIGRLANVSSWASLAYSKAKGDFGHEGPWLLFIEGKNPDYPAQILKATYRETLRRLEMVRTDPSKPAERNVHHWQQRNPVVLEGLVQTMLGGPNHIYHGGLLHVSVRYFDPECKRPGLPPHVAALVDRVSSEGIRVQLVNLHPTGRRALVIQGGAFGEHQFTTARWSGKETAVDNNHVRVILGAGAVGTLDLGLRRFARRPSYAVPWKSQGRE